MNNIDLSKVVWDEPTQKTPQIDLSQVKWDDAKYNPGEFIKEHPIKSIFHPISETLTGKSLGQRAEEKFLVEPMSKQAVEEAKVGKTPEGTFYPKPLSATKAFITNLPGAVVQGVTKMADISPFDVATIGAIGAAGKIPVGSTNVGRIASKVDVGKGFKTGVKELQALDSWLANRGPLSSRGIFRQPYNEGVDKVITKNFIQVMNPSTGKFKTKGQIENYQRDAKEAVKTMVDYSHLSKHENPITGDIEARLPRNRKETLDFAQEVKKGIWEQVSSMVDKASQEGARIDYAKIINDTIDPLLTNDQIRRWNPELIPKLERVKANVAGGKLLTPKEAQDELKFLNKQIEVYMKKGTAENESMNTVQSGIVYHLRRATDDAIESALQKGGYLDLRKQYGALKNVEGDLIKAAAKQMKGEKGGAIDTVLDAWASGDVLTSLLSHGTNPAGMKIWLARKAWQIWNHPDRKIASMFEYTAKNIKGKKSSLNLLPSLENKVVKPKQTYSESKAGLKENKGNTLKYLAGGVILGATALGAGNAQASQDIDMNKIYSIESSNNPKAYNKKSQARGLGQVRPIVLQEWNNYHKKEKHLLGDLLNAETNKKIASWYMNRRIPQMLKHYKIEDTLENRLLAYHDGIGNLIKYIKGERKLGDEMKGYLKKYTGGK